MFIAIGICVFIIIFFALSFSLLSRYKRCPSDKILVIFGNVGKDKTAKCIHGGASFVWPVIQDSKYLDLAPIQIDIQLKGALSKQQIRLAIPSTFTVGISTQPEVMTAAAERLLGLDHKAIQTIASEIIFGQLRQVVATMTIEEINADREKFLTSITNNVETELEKIGLRLINVNITDIKDESGYIESLGKNAASEALNKAKKDVAEKNRDGEIGQAEAEKEQRIRVAQANATAVEGENLSNVKIANSSAELRVKKAEAEKIATSAEKVQNANALKEAYQAEKEAELARADRERAKQIAEYVVKSETEKKQIEIAAEAEAEKIRIEAKGNADAIFATLDAQARGNQSILEKQAEGLKKIVDAAGGDVKNAATLLIVDKLDKIVEKQVEAIKNIQIDKIVVWDNGGNGKGTSTSNFLSGLMGSLPPLNNLFDMAGMQLPEFLGKGKEGEVDTPVSPNSPNSPISEILPDSARRIVKNPTVDKASDFL